MNDKELYALATEAERLANDVNARLDNPDYIFSGNVEKLVTQLREVAEQCREAHLRAAARRLEQLARDVQERSA